MVLFYPSQSAYNFDPFESFHSYQPDPYRLAALKRQRAEQSRRQREAEEFERQRESHRLRELERGHALAQREAQLRAARERKASLETRARTLERETLSEDGHDDDEQDEDRGEEEIEYIRHPFFGLMARRRPTRAAPISFSRRSGPSVQDRKRHSSFPAQPATLDPRAQTGPVRPASPSTAAASRASTPASSSSNSSTREKLDSSATLIQSTWRSHIRRKSALQKIKSLRSSFEALQNSFQFPPQPDFSSPSSSSPELAFTPVNKPIHAYEHSALQLLTGLDAVDSAGDRTVREARKSLVNDIEASLRELEGLTEQAWTRSRQTMEVDSLQQVSASAEHAILPAEDTVSNSKADDRTAEETLGELEYDSLNDIQQGLSSSSSSSSPEVDEDEDEDWVDAREDVVEETAENLLPSDPKHDERTSDLITDDDFDANVVLAYLSTA